MTLHRALLACALGLAAGVLPAQNIAAPATPIAPAAAAAPTGTARNEPPEYPPASRRNGEEGLVEVKVLVDQQGVPLKVEIHHSSGFPRLDNSARQTALRWRYPPGSLGTPGAEPKWVLVPFKFVLEDPPSPAPSK